MSFIVAIDGPAAAGKGTVSKAVAAHFGFAHLDTGLLYRVVGRVALEKIGPSLDEDAVIALSTEVSEADLERDDLRTAAVAQAASKVAVIPEVRSALVDFQRKFAARAGGARAEVRWPIPKSSAVAATCEAIPEYRRRLRLACSSASDTGASGPS